MNKYAKFREIVLRNMPKSNLTLANINRTKKQAQKFPELPDDYIEFLTQVGFGNLGESFSIFEGFVYPDNIFDEITAKELSNYIFIGSDFSGWTLAYDMRKKPFELVLFDHSSPCPFDKDKQPKTIIQFLLHELRYHFDFTT